MPRRSKNDLVGELIARARENAHQDEAFDDLAAELMGVSATDLRCLSIIENAHGLSAGELASRSGLTGGAVTGVLDRLERAGLAHRVADSEDRRRVRIEVTPAFYRQSERIWGPMAADFKATLTRRFSTAELELVIDYLEASGEIGARHLRRLREAPRG